MSLWPFFDEKKVQIWRRTSPVRLRSHRASPRPARACREQPALWRYWDAIMMWRIRLARPGNQKQAPARCSTSSNKSTNSNHHKPPGRKGFSFASSALLREMFFSSVGKNLTIKALSGLFYPTITQIAPIDVEKCGIAWFRSQYDLIFVKIQTQQNEPRPNIKL